MVINTFLVPGISSVKEYFFSFLEDVILITIFKDIERWGEDRKLVSIIILRRFFKKKKHKMLHYGNFFFLNKGL